jgi:hypothetical protein
MNQPTLARRSMLEQLDPHFDAYPDEPECPYCDGALVNGYCGACEEHALPALAPVTTAVRLPNLDLPQWKTGEAA